MLAVCRVCIFFLLGAATDNSSSLLVQTECGVVRGINLNGMRAFRGIPYAAPPLGDLRWQPPRKHECWHTTLNAIDFGPACYQYGPAWNSMNITGMSEDCLTLNVFAPPLDLKCNSHANAAVLVWFPAGEFMYGTANDKENAFPYFANGSIVVVTLQYRLGPLGFMALQALDAHAGRSGNFGMLDQRFALAWVQRNIHAFGGDPSRVTIRGESSGATSVAWHLTSRQSWPFFKRAILQSPGLDQDKSRYAAETNANFILAVLRVCGVAHCDGLAGSYLKIERQGLVYNSGNIINVSFGINEVEARGKCDSDAMCNGFTWDRATSQWTFVSNFTGTFAFWSHSPFFVSFMKAGPQEPSRQVACLMRASPHQLVDVAMYPPYGDTNIKDEWGPVVDGNITSRSLIERIQDGEIAPDVDILIGSTLDEGTFYNQDPTTPIANLPCDASRNDFEDALKSEYRLNTSAAAAVISAYTALQAPVPVCDCSDPSSSHWKAAGLRVAGDYPFACPIRFAIRKCGAGNRSVFQYLFTQSPSYSYNVPAKALRCQGSFHGSDVPYSWLDWGELTSKKDLWLGEHMACYWRRFIQTGDPNTGDCGDMVLPFWPAHALDNDVAIVLAGDGIGKLRNPYQRQCQFLRAWVTSTPALFV